VTWEDELTPDERRVLALLEEARDCMVEAERLFATTVERLSLAQLVAVRDLCIEIHQRAAAVRLVAMRRLAREADPRLDEAGALRL
jgi:hypothetical protein